MISLICILLFCPRQYHIIPFFLNHILIYMHNHPLFYPPNYIILILLLDNLLDLIKPYLTCNIVIAIMFILFFLHHPIHSLLILLDILYLLLLTMISYPLIIFLLQLYLLMRNLRHFLRLFITTSGRRNG